MNSRQALEAILDGSDLSEAQSFELMTEILDGNCDSSWIAGFLVALRQKGESVDELVGFARSMRQHATEVPCASRPLVDTCGTGGDASGSFNISTTAAFVAAGGGAHVAKHGNRSVSSQCGSADVLEALGAELDLSPAAVGRCVDTVGIGFLFAPALHGAMRHAMPARRALGIRTVFNLLGPLTNPASAPHQVMGVYAAEAMGVLGEVMLRLGNGRSVIVHGDDGLDELSVCAPSSLLLVDEALLELRIEATDFGLRTHHADALRGGDALENAAILRRVLDGEAGAPRDVVLLNAGAALWCCGVAGDLAAGVEAAINSIDSGAAAASLDAYIAFTQAADGS